MEKEIKNKKSRRARIIAVEIAFVATVLITVFVGIPLLKFASQPELFREWVESYGFWSRLAFIGMVIMQTVIALIPGEPFEMVAGYAFGQVEGTILCLAASTLGSVMVFLLVKRYGMKLAEIFFSKDKLESVSFLKSSKKKSLIFAIIFLLPGTPKDLVCYFAGMTDIPLPVWIVICSLGRLPSVLTSTVSGSALGEKDYSFAMAVLIVTLVLSGIGLLVYNYICRRNKNGI